MHRNRLLFLDTEFTGFNKNQDHLVQVAWVITDLEGNVLKNANYMVRPEDYEIPEESTAIHHIDTAQAATYGYPIKVVMEKFRHDLLKCCCLVGYTLHTDKIHIKKAWKELHYYEKISISCSSCSDCIISHTLLPESC